MAAYEDILETLENMTLAELKDELDLAEQYDDYPKVLKELVLYEIAKRTE